MIPFKPVIEPKVEGAFMAEHPIETIQSGRSADVPIIIGLNTEDGGLKAAGTIPLPPINKTIGSS